MATAGDGYSALSAIREYKPDFAVLDIEMPGLNGIEIARKVTAEQPRLGVIICTVMQEKTLIDAAMEAGARGYVVKANLYSDLLPAVNAMAKGEVFFPESLGAL